MRDSSESAGGGLFETQEDRSRESLQYSTLEWTIEAAMVLPVLESK